MSIVDPQVEETLAVLAHALLNRTAVITGAAEVLRLRAQGAGAGSADASPPAAGPDELLRLLVEQGHRVGEVLGLLARGRAAEALALATATR